jgi:type 1 glutamine amidotransferase
MWSGLRKLFLALVVLLALGLAGLWYIGAWNLVFPNHSHDTQPPMIPADLASPAVLVFSKTNAFRHREGIEGGQRLLQQIAGEQGWGVFQTENGAVFAPDILRGFKSVVFLNASGDMLNTSQEQAFREWLEGGGGWLGIHAAGDSSHKAWGWYMENLIGPLFTAHIMGPQFQRATVILENQQHPVLAGLPDIWQHEEEWYSWEQSPRSLGFTILATVDEDSYTPVQKMFRSEVDLRMGDHPVVWSNQVGRGRTVYSAMGHRAEAFDNPQHQLLLENALKWLMD